MAKDQDIIDLEKSFWQTMIDKDVQTATRLMADVSIVTGAQGAARISNDAFAKMMDQGQWTLKSFEFSDVVVTFPDEGTAIIGYRVKEKLEVDGKELEMEAADASVWTKSGDDWKCALHTESLLGDPYGRDRAKAKG